MIRNDQTLWSNVSSRGISWLLRSIIKWVQTITVEYMIDLLHAQRWMITERIWTKKCSSVWILFYCQKI